MAETTIKESTSEKDLSKELEDSPQVRLAEFLATHKINIARTDEELFAKSEKSAQTQEEVQAEVDEFMRMREEWRADDRKARREIE